MAKTIKKLAIISLFLVPCLSFGMEPKPGASMIKIQTSDEKEFEIGRPVAQTSKTLRSMIEDIGQKAATIPLESISGPQFNLLLPAMRELDQLYTAKPQASEKEVAQKLQLIVANLKLNDNTLTNQQLIEFIVNVNFLNIPLVQPALKTLAERILNKDELQQLVVLKDKLQDLWCIHPAKQLFSLHHLNVLGVIDSRYDNSLISWSYDTIKIWDKNKLTAEPIILHPEYVLDVIESRDGKNLISWGANSITIWDKNNLTEPITLPYGLWVSSVTESRNGKNLIIWSERDNTIKIWDKSNLDAKPKTLLLHVYVIGIIASRDDNNLIYWGGNTIIIWNNLSKPITLEHPGRITCVLESESSNLISCSKGTIKIWDKHNLIEEPKTLQHPEVWSVIESANGNNLISWAPYFDKSTIKIWDKNNLDADPITLEYPKSSDGLIESRDGSLIFWSERDSTIKIWDKALLNPTVELIKLLLTVYFVSQGQKFELTAEELAEFKVAFTTLSPMIQRMLEKPAPDFIAAVKSA